MAKRVVSDTIDMLRMSILPAATGLAVLPAVR